MMKTPRTKKKEKCEAIAVWRLEGDAVSVPNGEANRFPYSCCIRGREAKVA